MTYEEKRNLEEWIDVAIGNLLLQAKLAERTAKDCRKKIEIFEKAKLTLWQSETEETKWQDLF